MALVGARGIREALSEELTFELGPEASGGADWGEGAPGRGHSQYKGPRVRESLVNSRNRKKTNRSQGNFQTSGSCNHVIFGVGSLKQCSHRKSRGQLVIVESKGLDKSLWSPGFKFFCYFLLCDLGKGLSVLVSCCCVTNYPKTLWLK